MVGVSLKDAIVAPLGIGKLVAILMQQAEIQQCSDRCRVSLERTSVAVASFIVIAEAVVENAQLKKRF